MIRHNPWVSNLQLGERIYIGNYTVLGQPDNPSDSNDIGVQYSYIGDDSCIGNCCTISEAVSIGQRVKIGNNVVIRSEVIIGNDCIIGHGTVFEGKASVGEDTLIHAQCHITKGAKIGSRVFIAPLFVGANDPLCMRRKFMAGQPEFVPTPYIIEDDVRIGIGVIVLPGVRIGQGAQIGAGAIVTKDVDPWTLVVGTPARFRIELEKGGPELLY